MEIDKKTWKCAPISELFNLQMGKTPDRKNSSYWDNGNIIWLSIADMKQGKYAINSKEKLPEIAIKDCRVPIIPQGTVLMSFKLTIGKTCITGVPLATNEAIMAFLPKSKINKIDNDFLFYALPYIDWKGNRAVKGVTINKQIISNQLLHYPTLEIQKSIAAELDSIQEMITKFREQLEDYDKLAQSIFYEMFGDPVKNEKNWEKEPLNKIVHKECPISYGIVQPGEEDENGIPIVRPVDLTSTFVTAKELKKISKNTSDSYKRTILRGGEILMCVRGTTGVVSIASEDLINCNVTRGIVPLFFETANTWYMYYCIRTPQINNIIQKYTKGATLKQINISDLRNLEFPIPPLNLQKSFAAKIEKIESMKEQIKSQIADLQQLFDSRMQYYFK